MNTKELSGTVILGFGAQPIDFFTKATKACGKDAAIDPDVARMAGASFAIGAPDLLAKLREKLEAGALQSTRREHTALCDSAQRWLATGRHGISSETMFTVLTGVNAVRSRDFSHPHDPADFERCVNLLHEVPELRPLLPNMASVSKEWHALINHWDQIESLFLDEAGLNWTKSDSAPLTYKLMKQVLDC